jgi:hypothetical protein
VKLLQTAAGRSGHTGPLREADSNNLMVADLPESQTPVGFVAEKTLEGGSPEGRIQIRRLLKDARIDTLARLPECLDRLAVFADDPARVAIVIPIIKACVAAELESRTPHGVLAARLRDVVLENRGETSVLDILRGAADQALGPLASYLDRLAPENDASFGLAIPTIKHSLQGVLESRTPHGVLGQQVLEAIDHYAAGPASRRRRQQAQSSLLALLQRASASAVGALPLYLDQVPSQPSPEGKGERRRGAVVWIGWACTADLRRRELGQPLASIRLPGLFPSDRTPMAWIARVLAAGAAVMLFLLYLALK